jgi:hypothetical protein
MTHAYGLCTFFVHHRVLVTAVYKKTTNLKLHFFSNHSEIDKLNCCKEGLQGANEFTTGAEVGKPGLL